MVRGAGGQKGERGGHAAHSSPTEETSPEWARTARERIPAASRTLLWTMRCLGFVGGWNAWSCHAGQSRVRRAQDVDSGLLTTWDGRSAVCLKPKTSDAIVTTPSSSLFPNLTEQAVPSVRTAQCLLTVILWLLGTS